MTPCIQHKEIEELKRVITALREVPADVTAIKNELLGTPYTQGKGLIHEVSENKEEIARLKERYSLDKAWIFGAAAGITLIISILFNLFTK
jgi:hypothetical protein